MSNSEVEYRDLPGFPGYRIGSDGSFWSRRKRNGGLGSEWRQLKARRGSSGYLQIAPMRDGRAVPKLLHRAVLEAFIGPCPSGMEACHSPDPDRTNCRLENLRWDTRRANNIQDKLAHGRLPIGTRHHATKLSEEDVLDIRRRASAGEPQKGIAKAFGLSKAAVQFIVSGRTWKHLPLNPNQGATQ